MGLEFREPTADDAPAIGAIIYTAFKTIADKHGFPPDMPSAEMSTGVAQSLVAAPGYWGVVAAIDGRVVGSNFLDERASVVGLGPITVDPDFQDRSIGRGLMEHALERVRAERRPGVRLLQATYHNRSLSLYATLGFEVRALLSTLQGPPLGITLPGLDVRAARPEDLPACDALCVRVHGHDRHGQLADDIAQETATVVEYDGRIVGYASSLGFLGHAVAEHNDALKALIGAAPSFFGPGFLLPMTNGELFRWCVEHGLRVVQPMTLMTVGLYNEPAGPYLPSVHF